MGPKYNHKCPYMWKGQGKFTTEVHVMIEADRNSARERKDAVPLALRGEEGATSPRKWIFP